MRVLLVEDEAFIRMMLAEELTEFGYDVHEAETGDQAARLVEDAALPFELVITDIHMPGRVDGIQLAALVRNHRPAVPVVFTTGRPDVVKAADALRPIDVLVPKPFTPSELLDIVQRINPLR